MKTCPNAIFFSMVIPVIAGAWANVAIADNLILGKYRSRAIWTAASAEQSKAPVVILIPGSGAHGPEEMMPPSMTADGKDHALFSEFSGAFNKAGVHTLAVGKPGIEFFSGWDISKWFYDVALYKGLHWQDLIDNLGEAVSYVRSLSSVDPTRIYVLGHSEGTQVAVDYAANDPSIAGVILLGYAGEDLATIVDWQLFKRDIEDFIATDVDANHDGYVTKEEAAKWSEFQWNWQPGADRVSYQDIENAARKEPQRMAFADKMRNSPLYDHGIFNRGPIYQKTASLHQSVFTFTGALDLQTPPKEALALADTCKDVRKKNCSVTVVPGVGHGFSPPKKPRSHPLLDMTLGPVEPSFQDLLTQVAQEL
jgi:pimeloyl-ACP methyl ester carboxylesterase